MRRWGRIFCWVLLIGFIASISLVSSSASSTGSSSSGCGKPVKLPPSRIPPRPVAPSNLYVEIINGNDAIIIWSDNSEDESRFYIERSTDGVNYDYLDNVFPNMWSYIDENLNAFQTYFYRVYAGSNSSGNSGYSNVDSIEEIPAKIVFVTSSEHDGDYGGLSGADAFCQSHADSAAIAGTFKAWLSDSISSPSNRFIHSDIPYALVDGVIVAKNWSDLTDGTLHSYWGIKNGKDYFFSGINLDENGELFYSDDVYTGTDFDGTSFMAPPDNNTTCSDWYSSDRAYRGIFGSTYDNQGKTWTTGYPNWLAWCDWELHLYCFQQ